MVKKNQSENENTLSELKRFRKTQNVTSAVSQPTEQSTSSRNLPSDTEEPHPSTSRGLASNDVEQNEQKAKTANHPSDLVFESNDLKLTIVAAPHRQEKKFRLVDHMWHLLLTPTNNTKKMPLLSDILNFLLVAFNFMLNHLKKFYNPRVSSAT